MKIHLIAIGGSIMHNLALTLQKAGHVVTGSDDEIYEPALNRLAKNRLLPKAMGWDARRITKELDLVILGMHAKANNPELLEAQKLELDIQSFPEFIYNESIEKKRVVVAGSHGKTTTTSMILHVLKECDMDFDYLVGAQIEGFETMVQISDAPLIVIEGDEYLSSVLNRVPKIWHYRPSISIITGIAWDHMNVFPTWESYLGAFDEFLERMTSDSIVFYDKEDQHLRSLSLKYKSKLRMRSYSAFESEISNGETLIRSGSFETRLKIFGHHNLKNLKAAYLVLSQLEITDAQFFRAISSFGGAAKRLQMISKKQDAILYQDFAHAPSKVRATTRAVRQLYPNRQLTACVELHTFSSLSKEFLPQYEGTLDEAHNAIVFFSEHTLRMKKMPPISMHEIQKAFGRSDLEVYSDQNKLKDRLASVEWRDHNLLMMSSGTFGGIDLHALIQ